MKHEEIKHAYLFSCFCGLRISDVKRLKWKDVFVDSGQYRLAVSMKKTQEPIYLPLSSEALKWMPERGDKTPEDFVFELPSGNEVLYTTSKLLGHADVKMTQVYAKIVNKKKDEAVNLVNGLFD